MPHFGEKAGHDLTKILSSNNSEYTADQAGLQAAIDDLPAAGGWVSGPGMHTIITISTPITVPDNVKLMHLNLFLANNSDCNMIENSDQVAGNTGITIQNCYLDGNKANQASGHGIMFDEIENTTIEDVTAVDVKEHAFHLLNGTLNARNAIKHCRAITAGNTGFYLRQLHGLLVEGCFAESIVGYGYHFVLGYSIRCVGCIARNNTDNGFYIESLQEGIFNDCVSNHNGDDGIELSGNGAITIDGWSIFGNDHHGIYASTATPLVVVTGCYIWDNGQATVNTYDDIYVQGDQWVITGNVIGMAVDFRVRNGINIHDADDCVISGNLIAGCLTDGILLYNAQDTVISDNRITGNTGQGVNETGTSDWTLLDGCNLRGNTAGAHTVDAANSRVGDILP